MEGHLLAVNVDPGVVANGNANVLLNGATLAIPALFSDNFKIHQLPIDKVSEADPAVRENGVLTNILESTRGPCDPGLVCMPVEETSEGLADLSAAEIHDTELKKLPAGMPPRVVKECDENLQDDSQFAVNTNKLAEKSNNTITPLLNSEKGEYTDNPEPKKRKGGWPKGKKRRKEISTTQAPRAPSTGYLLFLNERRKAIKDVHPELPLAEIMKILGNEWSCLPAEEKQRYLGRAAEDKKRYSEELKIYQQSEAYQTYLKRKRLKGTYNVQLPISDVPSEESPSITIQDIEGEDVNDLYCKVCNMFFVSVHNKKEHLYGRQHLQALTGEIHKEAIELSGTSHCSEDESWSNSEGIPECSHAFEGRKCSYLCPASLRINGATNINQSILDFINLNLGKLGHPSRATEFRKLCFFHFQHLPNILNNLLHFEAREKEIKALREHLEETQRKNKLLQKELKELQKIEDKTKKVQETLKEEGKSLSSQLVNLRMVPTLFGVINF